MWINIFIFSSISFVRFKKSTSSAWKRRKTTSTAIFCATGAWGLSKLILSETLYRTYHKTRWDEIYGFCNDRFCLSIHNKKMPQLRLNQLSNRSNILYCAYAIVRFYLCILLRFQKTLVVCISDHMKFYIDSLFESLTIYCSDSATGGNRNNFLNFVNTIHCMSARLDSLRFQLS